nr:hypothetical protein [Bacteroidota bacterium]
MQHQLPIFPETTKLVNASVGIYAKDGFVYYLHNGSPVFCHAKEDRNSYRYILANLVVNGLCNATELGHAVGVNVRNVQRYAIALREHGMGYFFNREDNRGQCHKFTATIKEQAQSMLDKGDSQLHIAQALGISESAIRYHLGKGNLSKKK